MVELETSPKNIFDLIYDFKWRSKWEKVLSNLYIVDKLNEVEDVVYSFYKSPWGCSNRDFL